MLTNIKNKFIDIKRKVSFGSIILDLMVIIIPFIAFNVARLRLGTISGPLGSQVDRSAAVLVIAILALVRVVRAFSAIKDDDKRKSIMAHLAFMILFTLWCAFSFYDRVLAAANSDKMVGTSNYDMYIYITCVIGLIAYMGYAIFSEYVENRGY